MKINRYVDGYTYQIDQVPKAIRKYFIQIKDQLKLRVVGVHISKQAAYVFLPHNTVRNDLVSLSMIHDLCKSIIVAQNRLSNSELAGNFTSEISDMYSTISWLINDYYAHGIYFRREAHISKKDSGKIDWPTSIKKAKPFFVKDNLYIFDFFRKKKVNQEDIVSLTQKNILLRISKKYGFLFNNFNFPDNFRHLTIEKKSTAKQLLIQLRSILKSINVLRDKKLVQTLISYIERSHNNEGLSVITSDFHVIFEDAMKLYVHHDNSLQKYVPKAQWYMSINGHSYRLRNTQIPDGIVINKGKLDIYDAKYYDLSSYIKGAKTIFPPLDWYSVGKQFFYWKSFNRKAANVTGDGKNYFVFPYFPISNNSISKKIGQVHINIPDETLAINVLIMDPYKILKGYINANF